MVRIRYKGKRYYLAESKVNSVKGVRYEREDITILIINKRLKGIEKSKVLHKLIRSKDMVNIVTGKRYI